ncbi:MAG TPA: hypothetical protein PLK23_04850 [Clostridia bacterium]|jgi:ABC-2 type transport system permease protein|nr:hypothetical protein [Clostridiaceae bacterium]HOM34836.1 hypothetical protein [Clostridia bacterium]HQG00277.1 hypothetical protein [Clostridia bacterium]HQH65624.1 hypothetical protein [Clostridia bacterium]HQJ92329.1 hypothetical protein [Clostridia bacterium]
MNDLITLLKADLINTYKLNGLKDKSNRKKAIGMSLLALFLTAIAFLYIGGAAYLVSDILKSMGLLNILLVFAFALPFLVLFMVNIYKMPSELFSFKDYDMLMSLPVKDTVILAAKVIKLMLSGYVWQFYTSFPIFLVYCIKSDSINAFSVIIYIILSIVLPLLPMSTGSVIGFVVARISAKIKSRNIIMIAGSFALLALIMVFSFSLQNILDEQAITDMVTSIADIQSSFFLFDLYVDAVYGLNILSLLLFILIFTVPFILFIYLFAKSFKKINSSMMETKAHHSSKNVKFKEYSPVMAIFKKELNFYVHCVVYIVNTFFGMVLLLIGCIAVLVVNFDPESVFAEIAQAQGSLSVADIKLLAAATVFGYCIMMSSPTSASISLEGRNLWILKSMPVETKDIFKGKTALGLVVTLPIGIISSVLIYIGLKLSFTQWLILLAFTVSAGFLTAVLGLFANILFPKMEFKSPTEVVKQSASVAVAVFSGMFLVIIPMILGAALIMYNTSLFVLIVASIYAVITLILWRYLITKGVKRFAAL